MRDSVVTGTQSVRRPGFGRRNWHSWLWLLAGAALLPFALFQTVIPAAAWLAPVFLLRFARTQRARVALPALALVGYVATLAATRGFVPTPGNLLFSLGGMMMVIAFAADKWLAPRLNGVLRTLVFPLADVSASFLWSGGPLGTFGSPAYTQGGDLPLTQLVSVTGIWGLSFLIAWLAPVANELWERGFDLRAARASVGLFGAVMAAVVLFGSVRLAFFAPTAPTVRVAMLAPNRALIEAANAVWPKARSPEERAALRAGMLDPVLDDLLIRTRQAAAGGAKIVAWSEAAAPVFKEDEAAALERAREVARQEKIYVEVGLVVLLPTDQFPTVENRAVLLDPAGATLWDYPKSTRVFADGNLPGPGVLPVADTPYGRLTTAICFDADFPALIGQAGRSGADILLLPSSDWEPVAEMHSRMAVFRAIENGVTLVRPTRYGVSLAADPQGRLLGFKADYFVADDQTLAANVPTQGAGTLYARIGDSLAYGFVVGLAVLSGVAWLRRQPRPVLEPSATPIGD